MRTVGEGSALAILAARPGAESGPPARPELRGQSPLPQTLQTRAIAQHRCPGACPIGPLLNRRGEGSRWRAGGAAQNTSTPAEVDEPSYGLWERALPSKPLPRGWVAIPHQIVRRVLRGQSPLPQTLQARAIAQHRPSVPARSVRS